MLYCSQRADSSWRETGGILCNLANQAGSRDRRRNRKVEHSRETCTFCWWRRRDCRDSTTRPDVSSLPSCRPLSLLRLLLTTPHLFRCYRWAAFRHVIDDIDKSVMVLWFYWVATTTVETTFWDSHNESQSWRCRSRLRRCAVDTWRSDRHSVEPENHYAFIDAVYDVMKCCPPITSKQMRRS